MNISEAKKCVKKSIKGYKLQRNNDVFNKRLLIASPNEILNTYSLFCPNIAAVINSSVEATMILGAAGIAGLIAVKERIMDHPLSYQIGVLKYTESLIDGGCNTLENVTEDEFNKENAASVVRYKKFMLEKKHYK